MRSNQKGFSPVEVFVVLLIVGLIGTAGWAVYNRQQSNDPSTGSSNSEETNKNANGEYDLEVKKGYKLFENSEYYIQYPEAWKQYELADQTGKVFFASPDFKAPAAEGPGPTAESGYLLEVFGLDALPEDNFENLVKSSKESPSVGSYEIIKIDDNDAILTDQKTHGTYIDGITFKNNKQYYFRLNAADEDKPEVKELINTILETVQFK